MPAERPSPPLDLELETSRLVLRPPRPADVPAVRRLLRRNAEHLRPWSPIPSPGEDPSSLTEISKSILRQRRDWKGGESFVFFVVAKSTGGRHGETADGVLIGRVALTGIMGRAFSSAHLGYWIDVDHQSKGYVTESVERAVTFAFETLGLHRVQAAVMPRNRPSLRVLEKLGFRKEGLSARYLQIGGRWEDHEIFAVTEEEWTAKSP